MARRNERTRTRGKKPRESDEALTFGRRLWRVLWKLGLLLAVVGVVAAFGLYAHYARGLPNFGRLDDYQPPQISRVYAADGTPIAEFYRERRTVVPRDEIPEVLVQAVMAAEDADFYKHEGLDYVGMLRALYNSARAGRVTGSGSTITQQTVKNILLSQEKTFRRKAREIILTRRIEAHLSKDDILALYLNTIYLGHGRYGVQEAARFYFGKDVSQLDLNESAILAGVIQSPERHSPRKHPEAARRRRAYVLDQMVKSDFITRSQADRTKQADLALRPPKTAVVDDARWFVEIVRTEVLKHVDEERLLNDGLAIQTTFDLRRQTAAMAALRAGLRAVDARQGYDDPIETVTGAQVAAWQKKQRAALKDKPPPVGRPVPARVIKQDGEIYLLDLGVGRGALRVEAAQRLHPEGKLTPGAVYPVILRDAPGAKADEPRQAVLANGPQGAMVVLDPQTRDVLALVGGWDYTDYPYDRATLAKRQPGSSFKPFVWGAAFASKRYSPASIMVDAPETWQLTPGKWWTPKNYTGKYRGPISLRRALAESVNSVAVKLAHDVGIKNVHAFAAAAGIHSPLADNLSLALGS
ncbi:MAG: transglycosylase domain-containing protein, partial [Myxococcales bacterium]|nr:transglycosylase domain-containing protein [Myxococcales bacterium]